MRPLMRLTPPRRARRRIAGLVMPWMLLTDVLGPAKLSGTQCNGLLVTQYLAMTLSTGAVDDEGSVSCRAAAATRKVLTSCRDPCHWTTSASASRHLYARYIVAPTLFHGQTLFEVLEGRGRFEMVSKWERESDGAGTERSGGLQIVLGTCFVLMWHPRPG